LKWWLTMFPAKNLCNLHFLERKEPYVWSIARRQDEVDFI
jgi:hypothetical protein